jgi:hypothetical protein
MSNEKFPVTPAGIESVIFRFAAQRLNNLATAGWDRKVGNNRSKKGKK